MRKRLTIKFFTEPASCKLSSVRIHLQKVKTSTQALSVDQIYLA